jgi:hypothetical protein
MGSLELLALSVQQGHIRLVEHRLAFQPPLASLFDIHIGGDKFKVTIFHAQVTTFHILGLHLTFSLVRLQQNWEHPAARRVSFCSAVINH